LVYKLFRIFRANKKFMIATGNPKDRLITIVHDETGRREQIKLHVYEINKHKRNYKGWAPVAEPQILEQPAQAAPKVEAPQVEAPKPQGGELSFEEILGGFKNADGEIDRPALKKYAEKLSVNYKNNTPTNVLIDNIKKAHKNK